jgi:hypothetical protein
MRIEWLERLKASLGGYFWLPCPNCGRMFGGQEGRRGEVLWNREIPGKGLMTCSDPVCKAQVRARNKANGLPEGAWLLESTMEDFRVQIAKQVLDHHAPEEYHIESNRRTIAGEIAVALDEAGKKP